MFGLFLDPHSSNSERLKEVFILGNSSSECVQCWQICIASLIRSSFLVSAVDSKSCVSPSETLEIRIACGAFAVAERLLATSM
eukprot:13776858-Alexandrium_andersonii.AAC.1